jgi:hypothetical protein
MSTVFEAVKLTMSTDKSCMWGNFVFDVGVKKNMVSKAVVTTLTKDFPDPVSTISKERTLFELLR